MFSIGTDVSERYSRFDADDDFERNFEPYRKNYEERISDLEQLVYVLGMELLSLKEIIETRQMGE